MTWPRVNPLGWAFMEVLTSTQMNALDIDHTEAIDGVGGGTYAPSSPIIFDGDVQWAGTLLPKLESRTYRRVQGKVFLGTGNKRGLSASAELPYSGADFVISETGLYAEQAYVNATPGANDRPSIYLACPNLIDRASLHAVGAWFRAYATGSYPEFVPRLSLYRRNSSSEADLQLVTALYSLGSSTYRTQVRYISTDLSGGSGDEPIDQSTYTHYNYVVQFEGESGNQAVTALKVYSCWLDFIVTELVP